jgi:hypothetical protein
MAIRFQKNGMTSIYKGVEVTSNCSSLSEGLELMGENGVVIASFTPQELKEMVKNSVAKHGVRKFALLVDNANGADMDLFLINPSTVVKYWDEILSLNTTGKNGRFALCLRSTRNGRMFLNIHADKIEKFVSKSQLQKLTKNKNLGYAAEIHVFGNTNQKPKNHLVDGYMVKNTKKGKSYRFSIQLKCSSNRANTNGIVKF